MSETPITVKLPGLLAHCAGGAAEVTVSASTLKDALDRLVTAYPLLRVHLFDDRGAQREHVMIMYNDNSIRWMESLDKPLADGDRITILQLVTGG